MKTKHFFHSLALAAMFAMSSLVTLSPVSAQSDLADEDRATVLFDVRMGKMRDGDFMQGLKDQFEELQDNMGAQSDFDPEKVERIFGAASLPDSMEEFNEPDPPESVQFFVRMKMVDADSAQELLDTMNGEEVELEGEAYISPAEGIYAHLIEDENTLEIGTEKYITLNSRRVFTERLDAAFKKTPDFGIRLVVDLASESELISEAVDEAMADAPPMMEPILGLIENAEDLSICIDFDSDNLLSIAATGKDEEKAEELRGGLDGLLGMAKMLGSSGVDEIPDPDMAKLAKDFLDSLRATRDGLTVRIDIPHPEGLDEAIKQALEMAPMMMGGGMGPDF